MGTSIAQLADYFYAALSVPFLWVGLLFKLSVVINTCRIILESQNTELVLIIFLLSFPFTQTNEWNKNDDRLLQAVENGDPEKVASLLGKKGASATKQDSEGKTA